MTDKTFILYDLSYDIFKKSVYIKKYLVIGVILLIIANIVLLPFFLYPKDTKTIEIEPFRFNNILLGSDEQLNPIQTFMYSNDDHQYYIIFSFALNDIYPEEYTDIVINNISLYVEALGTSVGQYTALLYYIDIGWDSSYITYNMIYNNMIYYKSFNVENTQLSMNLTSDILDYSTESALNLGLTFYTTSNLLETAPENVKLIINFTGTSTQINIIVFLSYIVLMIVGLYLIYTSISYNNEKIQNYNSLPKFISDSLDTRYEKNNIIRKEFP